ncbi:hypothetical protein [Variovorax paradoxus]
MRSWTESLKCTETQLRDEGSGQLGPGRAQVS